MLPRIFSRCCATQENGRTKERQKLAQLIVCEADDPRVTEALSETEVLRLAAPAFTTVWLSDILDRIAIRKIPEIQNTEGDELLFCTVQFPLGQSTTDADIRSALGRVPVLVQENPAFWNWIATGKSAMGGPKKKPKLRNAQTFVTTLDDGSPVLGNIELKDRSLMLSANSKTRAERGRALLAEHLGELVGQPLVEMQTVEQLLAPRDTPSSPPPADLSPKDHEAIVHATLDKHYRDMLDEPIPMLGNISPRMAAKTTKGRSKVVVWLKTLENHSAKFADSKNAMATYDVTWLWTELGVSDLRR